MSVLQGNDWSRLVPPAGTSWTPTRTVSVCIPCRNPSHNLERTLDALALQTYPLDLVEVVVADDGSDEPLVLPDRWPFPVRVVRLEPQPGFGAGRARNAAARAATGEVLVLLDADVVPEKQVLACYLRWFEQRTDVVPMGLCRFAETGDLADDELLELVRTGGMAAHFAGRDVDDQSWRETTFRATDDLRVESVDAFRIVVGATFAVSAERYAAVGGFRELGIRGIEDTEIGYRLHADGCVLVLDRDADHWHQGRRTIAADRRDAIREARKPYVQRLLPVPPSRTAVPVPLDEPVVTVPRVVVHVEDGDDAQQRLAQVRALLPGDCVAVVGDDDPVLDGSVPFLPAFAHLFLPATATPSASTVEAVVATLLERQAALLVAQGPEGERLLAVTTRALRRARREAPGEDLVAAVSARFRPWHSAASSIGVSWPGDGEAVEELPGV